MAVAAAAILGRTVIHIAEPRRTFEPHAAQPRVLRLRKWVDSEKDIEILLVGKAAEAVIALGDIRHRELKTVDSSGYADAGQ